MAKRKPARAKAANTAARKSTRSSKAATARTRKAAPTRGRRSAKAAKKKTASAATRRRTVKKAKTARKATAASRSRARKTAARTASRKTTSRTTTARKATAARPKAKTAAPAARSAAGRTAPRAAAPKAASRLKRPPNLDRARKTAADADLPTVPSSLRYDRSASAARTGRDEMREKLQQHTSTSPTLTAGDVDADWEAAATVGDEAPGGDNPTPDQDIVENIGRALGVEYDDDEELKGGEEIMDRDRHRWELDPASSDDFDER